MVSQVEKLQQKLNQSKGPEEIDENFNMMLD
jgi:hypothetical protein